MTRRSLARAARPRRGLRFLALTGLASVMIGCPSVDPGPLAPDFIGPQIVEIQATCRYALIDSAEPADDRAGDALRRVERDLARAGTTGFRVESLDDRLVVHKTVLHPPGLLRDLELNRFLAALLLAAAEDDAVTFYRGDALENRQTVSDIRRKARARDGRSVHSLADEAFRIYDGATPFVCRFEQAALRVPFEQVKFRYRPEAAQLSLEIEDEALIADVRRAVGWDDVPQELDDGKRFAERMMTQRTISVAIGGVVVIEDQIRPGAQTVMQGDKLVWSFSGMVTGLERGWAESVFARRTGRRLQSVEIVASRGGRGATRPDPDVE